MEPFVPHSHKKILIILICKDLIIKIFLFVSLQQYFGFIYLMNKGTKKLLIFIQ
jgi:hypothetical protein